MQLRFLRYRLAFQHLLNQVNAAARTIQLVAKQLIGRAGGKAESAMNTSAYYRFGFLPFGRILDESSEFSLHYLELRIHSARIKYPHRIKFFL